MNEPTIGEVMRTLAGLQKSVDQLASVVLTVPVWKAEREHIEYRLREVEKAEAEAKANARAEREKRESERSEAIKIAAATRRQVIFAVLTSFVAPVLVGVVFAYVGRGS